MPLSWLAVSILFSCVVKRKTHAFIIYHFLKVAKKKKKFKATFVASRFEKQVQVVMVVWEIAKSKNKLLSWQHCRLPRHFSMSHQSPKPLPFFHSYSSRSKHVAASACNAGPHISDFPSTSLNPFPFQRPPAPIADTSARPPLLAVQAAQALQLFPWMSHNPAACSYSSWSSVKLPPLATQALACLSSCYF